MASRSSTITPDNKAPLAEFAAYLLVVTSILTVGIKIGTKFTILRTIQSDDWFALASLAFAVAQCGTAVAQARNGLGQRWLRLTNTQIEAYQKATYATDFQYVLSVGLAKMATLQYLKTIALDKRNTRLIQGMVVADTIWTVIGILGVAFQCATPRIWEVATGRCDNQAAFWVFLGVMDILVDFCIISLPVLILHPIQMSRTRKWNAITAFGVRIFVIPATISRMIYIVSAQNSEDISFDSFRTALMTTICTNVSIIFACISFVKPFLDSIETGTLASRIRNPTSSPTYSTRPRQTILRHARALFNGSKEDDQEPPLVPSAQQPAQGGQSIELNAFTTHIESEPVSGTSRNEQDSEATGIARTTDLSVELLQKGRKSLDKSGF